MARRVRSEAVGGALMRSAASSASSGVRIARDRAIWPGAPHADDRHRSRDGSRRRTPCYVRSTVDVADLLVDLDRDGYAIREGVLGPTEVARLRAALDPILERTP